MPTTRARLVLTLLAAVALLATTAAAASAHHDDDVKYASAFELAMGDDAIATLPVFRGPFPETRNMRFLSQISPANLGALPMTGVTTQGRMNDIWGWTSPAGEEYALATNSGGAAIVRVTDPKNPVYLGQVPSEAPGSFRNIWGDPATFGHYAYFVTEINPSHIQILDLSGLDALGPAPTPGTVIPAPLVKFNGGGYLSAHNIQVNETSGFAYVAGVRLQAGAANNACGLATPPRFNTLILDVGANPTNPPVAACLPNVGEHDFHVVNYDGPDDEHDGKEIAFVFDGRDRTGAFIGGFTEIWDVSAKNAIQVLAKFRTPGMVFSHNGFLTEEHDFLFIGDEVDELVQAGWQFTPFFAQPVANPTNKPQTGTYVIDIRDLDAPAFHARYTDGTVGLDHNFVVEGDKLYIASYTSGTRVLHIGRDGNDDVVLSPFAEMDTEPRLQENILNINQEEKFGTAFNGQWGIYAFPGSGTIIATDINNGLIVMDLSPTPCKGIKCSQ